MIDWLGSGAKSARQFAQNIIAETIRRVKLEAKNDPAFVPPANDASGILAARHFVLPPDRPERRTDDAQLTLAQRVFGRGRAASSAGTPLNIPWRLAQRDGAGKFAATEVTLDSIRTHTGPTYDFILFAPDGTTKLLQIPTGTDDFEVVTGHYRFLAAVAKIIGGATSFAIRKSDDSVDNLLVSDAGDVTVRAKFGCNGTAPQAAVVVPGAAGGGTGGASAPSGTASAVYDAPTQALIDSLVSAANAQAAIINTDAAAISNLAALVNAMRAALIADGILT